MNTHDFILTGEAGSGKTETVANLTLRLAEDTPVPVCLTDTDQAECMFRIRDFPSLLERGHVYVAVNLELWDSPLMPQGVTSLLKDDSICRVLDAGGSAVDATILGQFAGLMAEKNTSYYYVVNPCCAFSGSMEDILESLSAVPIPARIPAEGLKFTVNPSMGGYTTPELVMEHVKHLEAELGKAGLGLHGLAVSERFFGEVGKPTGLLILELNTSVDRLYV